MTDEPRRRLANAVRSRRLALRLSQAQLAAEAGITERTVRLIEHADDADRTMSTMRGVAQALGWTPESLDLILAGQEPVEASAPKPVDDPVVMQMIRELQDRLAVVEAQLGIRQRAGTEGEQAELEADAEARRVKRQSAASR